MQEYCLGHDSHKKLANTTELLVTDSSKTSCNLNPQLSTLKTCEATISWTVKTSISFNVEKSVRKVSKTLTHLRAVIIK